MKNNKTIFLSYRRDDSPGYVSKLEKDLEHFFGEDNVFRDVEDIAGGEQWKQVLQDKLQNSGALLVIIGPRWEQIWNDRKDKDNDYIVYELNEAKEQGITIIPVTINGTKLSRDIDLGPISWLMDNQQYDLTDTQGRWPTDVSGLVNLLEHQPGIEKIYQEKEKKEKKKFNKLLWIPIILGILFVIGLLGEPDQPVTISEQPVIEKQNSTTEETKQSTNQIAVNQKQQIEQVPERVPQPSESPATSFPDVSGLWQAEDGTAYMVGKVENGRFPIGNTDYRGEGVFIPKMPRKFKVTIPGLGHGEYSITTDNQRVVGWFIYDGSYEKEYETLWRVE